MGTIKLPTYQPQQIDRPAGAAPRPDLQGMAALGNAQNRFIETLFGIGEFASKLATDAQNQQRADEFSASQRAYKEQLTNMFLEIEKNPISTRDPRSQNIPEGERSLPNLSIGAKSREDIYQGILGGIKDERVKKAFTGWAADRWISEKESLAIKDIGWQKSVGMDYFKQDIGSAIDRGDVGGADDVIANARVAGLINDANVAEYRDLARKDVTKRGVFLVAQGMGDAGMGFLTNPDNLRYTGVDGKPKEMPLADRENLIQKFKGELAWQENQAEVQNGKLDLAMSDAFVSLQKGEVGSLSMDMVDEAGWVGKEGGNHQQRWLGVLNAYNEARRSGSDKNQNPDPNLVPLLAGAMSQWRQNKLTTTEVRNLLTLGLASGMDAVKFNEWDKELNSAPKSDPSSKNAFDIIDAGTKKDDHGRVLYDIVAAGKLSAQLQDFIQKYPDVPEKWLQYATNLSNAQAKLIAVGKIQTAITGATAPSGQISSMAGLEQVKQGQQITGVTDAAKLQQSVQEGSLFGVWQDHPEYKTQLTTLSDMGAKRLAASAKVPIGQVRRNIDENGQITFGVPTGRRSGEFVSYQYLSENGVLYLVNMNTGTKERVQ